MTQHTPGPWHVSQRAKHCIAANGRDHNKTIAVMKNTHNDDWKANAQLIAAAPELLEACYKVLASYKTDDLESYAIPAIEQAITKARGALAPGER